MLPLYCPKAVLFHRLRAVYAFAKLVPVHQDPLVVTVLAGLAGGHFHQALNLPFVVSSPKVKATPARPAPMILRGPVEYPEDYSGRCVRWLFLALFGNGGKPRRCQNGVPLIARAPIERPPGGIVCRLPR